MAWQGPPHGLPHSVNQLRLPLGCFHQAEGSRGMQTLDHGRNSRQGWTRPDLAAALRQAWHTPRRGPRHPAPAHLSLVPHLPPMPEMAVSWLTAMSWLTASAKAAWWRAGWPLATTAQPPKGRRKLCDPTAGLPSHFPLRRPSRDSYISRFPAPHPPRSPRPREVN